MLYSTPTICVYAIPSTRFVKCTRTVIEERGVLTPPSNITRVSSPLPRENSKFKIPATRKCLLCRFLCLLWSHNILSSQAYTIGK